MLQNRLKTKVEIIKEFTSEYCMVIGNEGKLHQAILNILSNAEQSIQEKGVIEIKTNVFNTHLSIEISDSGCGIDQANIQKVFDPFFTTKSPGQGTGLGLSITYKIIQEHNGTIEIESLHGQGTKVIVHMPIRQIN
jgi:signal transduction histidine kinase